MSPVKNTSLNYLRKRIIGAIYRHNIWLILNFIEDRENVLFFLLVGEERNVKRESEINENFRSS